MEVHLVHDELLIGCVQVAVLQVLEQHAVELVGAALHDLIELPARGMAIFRRELVCQQREFFHRIIRDDRKRTGHGLAIVVDSLDGEVVVARALSADGRAAAHTHRAAGRNAGTEQGEVDHAGTGCGGRQIRDLALGECGAYLCVRRVNTRCQRRSLRRSITAWPTCRVTLVVIVRFSSTLRLLTSTLVKPVAVTSSL